MTGHVLHLATTHTPRDPRIVLKEAQTMAEAGLRVGVVTPADGDGQVGDVETFAVPMPRGGIQRMTTTTASVVRRALELAGPDTIFHLHDADLLAPGLLLARKGRRVVYDAHEDTPQQMLHQHWIPRPLRRPVGATYRALEAAAGRRFLGVLATVPTIYDRYPASRTALIRNFPIVDELAPPSDAVTYAAREPIVTYVGALTPARGLAGMLAAIDLVPDAALHLAGSFHPESLADETRRSAGSNVEIHGRLGRPDVASLLARSRIGLSVLLPTASYLEAYPTKLFEYMAAGLPVVASDSAVIRRFVEPSQCGVLVDPQDPKAIAEAITWLLDHPGEAEEMGRRGQAAVRERFAWSREGERLLAFYQALLDGNHEPGVVAHREVPC